MGPKGKKQQQQTARKRRGLLGLASGYNSASDDDYEPSKPKQAPRKKQKRSKTASDSSDADSDATLDSDTTSSDSTETLAARQQRKLSQQSPAQGAAKTSRGRVTVTNSRRMRGAAAAAAAGAATCSSWDQLPTAVLAQIFLAVTKHGALPMAPRLACVCTSFHAAVTSTPELFRLLDTAAIPSRTWGAAPGSRQQQPGSKGKGRASNSRAAKQLTAEEGLQLWVASGRLAQMQALLLYGDGGGGGAGGAGGEAAAGGNCSMQLSGGLLMQIADSCQALQRVSMFGAFNLRPEEVSAALLSMPSLSELWLCGVRFSSLTGLNTCLCSVLDAAAASGHPKLKRLVVEDCLSLGQKVVSSLCPAAVAAPAQADAAAGSPGLAEQQQPQQQQTGSPAAGLPAGQQQRPQFEHLEVLDLSRSAGLNGRPVKFQLDEMQAAMPNLRVLKLSGLGGPLYGFHMGVRVAALLPGFPALTSLHLDAAQHNSSNGQRNYLGSSSIDSTVLLQLVGRSIGLQALDLSGCPVGPDGLRELAAAHAAARAAGSGPGPAGVSAAAAAAARLQSNAGASAAAAAAAAATAGSDSEDEGSLAAAAAVRGALRVRDLQLDGSGLATDEGLEAVGQCCCDTLEQLVVRNAGRRLGDEGIRALKGCSRLTTLDIAGCSVTEEGLADLLAALPAGVLEELHLESCRSLSRGARQAAARGVTHLQQYFSDNKAHGSDG